MQNPQEKTRNRNDKIIVSQPEFYVSKSKKKTKKQQNKNKIKHKK